MFYSRLMGLYDPSIDLGRKIGRINDHVTIIHHSDGNDLHIVDRKNGLMIVVPPEIIHLDSIWNNRLINTDSIIYKAMEIFWQYELEIGEELDREKT